MQHNGDGQNNENFWGENLSIDFDSAPEATAINKCLLSTAQQKFTKFSMLSIQSVSTKVTEHRQQKMRIG